MIKHPNIVQYLGTTRDPRSRRLALLMELMDGSLTKLLERSSGPLPYYIQLNICNDVALALSYLHSNAIIHRDLSSNNVLLISEGTRAKVTDFGMSKLTDVNPRMTPLTLCPGASVYMPPEALTTPPRYSSKLDCFSHGVLTIQIVTRNFPDPGDAHESFQDPRFPKQHLFRQVPEIERRKKDIDLINPDHSLLPIALHCLEISDKERPSSDELCERLATLKREEKYALSVEQVRNQPALLQRLQEQVEQKDQLIQECQNELTAKDELIEHHRNELEVTITEKNRIIEKQNQTIKQLRQNLEENPESATSVDLIRLTWRKGAQLPEDFSSLHGMAVAHGNVAYFSYRNDVYSFSVADNRWAKLPSSIYENFSMAVIDDKLTAIGGSEGCFSVNPTNSLRTLLPDKGWTEVLPAMPTGRTNPGVATTHTHLVVAGGQIAIFEGTDVVEVLNTSTLQWSTAKSLPKQIFYPQTMAVNDKIYLMDYSEVFTCLAGELMKSSTIRSDDDSVWRKSASIPIWCYSSLAVLKTGQVLALGGCDNLLSENPKAIVHGYSEDKNAWKEIGELPIPLYRAITVVLPSNETIVVGGYVSSEEYSRSTFICSVA